MYDKYKFIKKGNKHNIIIIALIISIASKCYQNKIVQNKLSYITLKINSAGDKKVFHENDQTCGLFSPPQEVYINGINQNYINFSYNFNESINDVKLIWNDSPLSANCLFYKCKDINEIDLSHFETRETNISYMFAECTSLTFINLSNFNTSKVIRSDYLFYNCAKLISIDLSSFDSSNIISMIKMFLGCKSLISINLSNFLTPQLQNTNHMFEDCHNLTSVNLSTFDFSQNKDMSAMFYKCYSLKTIELPVSQTPLWILCFITVNL